MADSKTEYGKLQAAMAFRVKYRLDAVRPKRRIAMRSFAPHLMNRGGHEVYPNPIDVRALGLKLIQNFDYAEANHNGVAVEEIPPEVRATHGFKDPWTGGVYEGIGPYNDRNCRGHEIYAGVFNADLARSVIFGALSHSHLALVLLCIMVGAKWSVRDKDGNHTFPCDRAGNLDASAVADQDPVLKQILQEGLEFEILSYKIYMEEPTACSLISDALNNAQKIALKQTELSALSALTGAVGLSAVAGEVNFDAIKAGLRTQLETFVDEPEFIEMFDFVVKLGANRNSYLPNFLKFTSKCVSSKFRRLRLQTCTVLNKCKAGPLGKIALAKRSLRSKPGPGGHCPAPESELEKRSEAEFYLLEQILLFFHQDCKAAVAAAVPEEEQTFFFANVDGVAADAFVKTPMGVDPRNLRAYRDALVSATAKYWKQLDDAIKDDKKVSIEECVSARGWKRFKDALAEKEDKEQASAVADITPTAPVLIRYDEARSSASNAPEIRVAVAASTARQPLPWVAWLRTQVAKESSEGGGAEAAAKLALRMLHTQACRKALVDGADGCPAVDVQWDPKDKAKVVVTTKLAEAGSIELMPCVPKYFKLRSDSTHPDRVHIYVFEKTQHDRSRGHDFYVHPEWETPEEAVLPTNATGEHRVWKWKGGESMHPRWAVRRMTQDHLRKHMPGATFNMEERTKLLTIMGIGGASSLTYVVKVPVLTNTVDIQTGVELIFEAIPKPVKAVKAIDWKDDQKTTEAKRQGEERKRKREEPKEQHQEI